MNQLIDITVIFLGKYQVKTFTVETSRAIIETLRGIKMLIEHVLEEGQEYVLQGKFSFMLACYFRFSQFYHAQRAVRKLPVGSSGQSSIMALKN